LRRIAYFIHRAGRGPRRRSFPQDCASDTSVDRTALDQVPERRGAKLLQVSLAGMDRRVPLLAMSEHMLAERGVAEEAPMTSAKRRAAR